MIIRTADLIAAIKNAPAPERNGQRHNITLRADVGGPVPVGGRHPRHTVFDEYQIALISSEFNNRSGRWFEWTVDL